MVAARWGQRALPLNRHRLQPQSSLSVRRRQHAFASPAASTDCLRGTARLRSIARVDRSQVHRGQRPRRNPGESTQRRGEYFHRSDRGRFETRAPSCSCKPTPSARAASFPSTPHEPTARSAGRRLDENKARPQCRRVAGPPRSGASGSRSRRETVRTHRGGWRLAGDAPKRGGISPCKTPARRLQARPSATTDATSHSRSG